MPVDKRTLRVLERHHHVIEMGIVNLPELRVLDDGVEVHGLGGAGGNGHLADGLREDGLRILHRLVRSPVLHDRGLDGNRRGSGARVDDLDGRVDVAELRLVAHEHVRDADGLRHNKVDATGNAAEAVREREHVVAPLRPEIVAPAEVSVRVRDPDGELVLPAELYGVRNVDFERRLQHQLVSDELPVHENLGALAYALLEEERDAASLRGRRHGELAAPPADALVVARLALALAVARDRVEEVLLYRTRHGDVYAQRTVLPRIRGLRPRDALREERSPSARRSGDRQRLRVDRREPVRAPVAYLRRVDGVDVELVGLVLGLPVEPKAPSVATEAVDNAFSAERPERRNCGKSEHQVFHGDYIMPKIMSLTREFHAKIFVKKTQSRYLPFQNGWRSRRVCFTGRIVPSSLK